MPYALRFAEQIEMDYPNKFNTPIFPEARRIAFSRVAAIWYFVLFFLILSLSGILIWTTHSLRLAPYIITINSDTGEWTVITETPVRVAPVSATITMQEFVVYNFARNWFSISASASANDINWCECDRVRCARATPSGERPGCFLCCNSDATLHRNFLTNIVPDFRARYAMGETQELGGPIVIDKIRVNDNGGLWRMRATLQSSIAQPRQLEIYIRVARNMNLHPGTLGYFVSEIFAFNVGEIR